MLLVPLVPLGMVRYERWRKHRVVTRYREHLAGAAAPVQPRVARRPGRT